MASSDVWTDFEQIRHAVRQNTVDKLKHIITGLNEECGTNLSKSGKKQDIIDRICYQLEQWRGIRSDDKWLKAKVILSQVRSFGSYNRPSTAPVPNALPPAPTFATASYSSSQKLPPYSALNPGGSSSGNRYDPYAPPRKPQLPTAGASSSAAARAPTIRFRDSPFFHIDQQVSTIIECPESTSAMDRRQQTMSFTLNPEQIAKLKQDNSKYQLRLFCTSSVFYTPSTPAAFRATLAPCPIEFPPTCEVRVNGTQLTANLKGLKKKPGTAPPPDLGASVRVLTTPNRLEMVYVNSSQPVQPKKFYLVVMLVEATSVERLVDNLKINSRRTSQEIKQKMLESMSDDDDIQAGPQKMSLKCPLSYMRVNTPCRSSKCVHSQCFDATSWFSMMEQTTTYLCPTCERPIDYRDLIIDGYFDDILKETPESVEDVIVEADGEWHTSDNKYGSGKWKATHPVVVKAPSPTKQYNQTPLRSAPSHTSSDDKGKGKANADVVVLVDSEDEEEGQVKRELSPSNARSLDSLSFSSQLNNEVIDLTLSDDDEPAPPPSRSNKRSAESADLPDYHSTEPWKKTRSDSMDQQQQQQHQQQHSLPPLPPLVYPNNHVADPRGAHLDRTTLRPLVPGQQNISSLNGFASRPPVPGPPIYNTNFQPRQSLTDSRQLPPITYPSSRTSGLPRWG